MVVNANTLNQPDQTTLTWLFFLLGVFLRETRENTIGEHLNSTQKDPGLPGGDLNPGLFFCLRL